MDADKIWSEKVIKKAGTGTLLIGQLLISGCVVPINTRVYHDQYCYNQARLAVHRIDPKVRPWDEKEVTDRTYDNCMVDRQKQANVTK
jgi:hypothetical protein